ncbi:MAG: cation:proton antiporter [Terriglobales bacterium]
MLVGAVLACTSSSIVLPLLQQLKLSEPVKITLLLEASLGDVFGVLTVGYLIANHSAEAAAGSFLTGLAWRVVFPLLVATVAGALWSRLLLFLADERFWHVLTFGVVLLLFAGTEALHASGLIAVLGFGLTLANFSHIEQRLIKLEVDIGVPASSEHLPMLAFHSELAFLVRTFFFVLLGVVVEFVGVQYVVPTLGTLGAIFLGRWLAVHMSRWSWRDLGKEEHELVVWILPRGLITAVLAIQVFEARGEEFAFLPAVAFVVILATNLVAIVGGVLRRVRSPRGGHRTQREGHARVALQDVATAVVVYQRALAAGTGKQIAFGS